MATIWTETTKNTASWTNANKAGGKGVNWRGAWSGTTAYLVNDAVSSGGSNYNCILGNTNQQPPNATYWEVI